MYIISYCHASKTIFMDLPGIGYFFEYLYIYTGKEPLTTLFYIFGIRLFVTMFFIGKNRDKLFLHPGYLLTGYSLVSVIIVTYIVSFFKPVINQQSMMAAMPFVVIAVAIGYQKFNLKTIIVLFAAIFISNILNFAFLNTYYTKNAKENFKQISQMVEKSVSKDSAAIVVSQIAPFYNYYFKQLRSQVKAYNPNENEPEELLKDINTFYVINAPFTSERSRQMEEIDELGFLILYPGMKEKTNTIKHIHTNWVNYIEQNYKIDSVYIDPLKNFEVGFRYKKQ